MKLPIWLRLFFGFVLAQALLVGSAIVRPALISLVVPWAASPLNARFIAALYLMGAVSALLCMIATSYAEVRVSLIEIGLVTGGLLLITVPHFAEFPPGRFPYRWTIFYTVDPLASAIIVWVLRGNGPPANRRSAYALLFWAYAGVLGVAGLVLLALPDLAASLWPWALPPILGQVYSVFFLTFAAGGLLAAREPGRAGARVYLIANAVMLGLILGASLLHADRFTSSLAALIWCGVCLLGLAAFAAALARRPGQIVMQEAAE